MVKALHSKHTYLMKGTPGNDNTITWSELVPVFEIPEFGSSPSTISTTDLTDDEHTSMPALIDNSKLGTFKCNYNTVESTTRNGGVTTVTVSTPNWSDLKAEMAATEPVDYAIAFGKVDVTSNDTTVTKYGTNGMFKFKGNIRAWVVPGGVDGKHEINFDIFKSNAMTDEITTR